MSSFEQLQQALKAAPHTWLVTGAAGFIGSNLVEALLALNQRVVGLDNFSTGHQRNLDQVRAIVGSQKWAGFSFIKGDIRELETCRKGCSGAEYVLQQAALGSVPRSMKDPIASHENNVSGFLNMLVAARDANVKGFVYASSSSVYGDAVQLPKVEGEVGHVLSPYAATKAMNEIYADVFDRAYGFKSIGLRYFNVFGPRQDPEGAYAAVIPKWIAALLKGQPVLINGDGETSRDFCFVANVVQANLLAATTTQPQARTEAYNVAVGERSSLNQLFRLLQEGLRRLDPGLPEQKAVYQAFRAGDVRHSLADISKAQRLLGYQPTHRLEDGLSVAMGWYRDQVS